MKVKSADAKPQKKIINREKKVKSGFEDYLKKEGYKEYTAKGAKSTVFKYSDSIEFVMQLEGISSWKEVADKIDYLCSRYDVGGAREAEGAKSKNTVICALKRFKEFIATI